MSKVSADYPLNILSLSYPRIESDTSLVLLPVAYEPSDVADRLNIFYYILVNTVLVFRQRSNSVWEISSLKNCDANYGIYCIYT